MTPKRRPKGFQEVAPLARVVQRPDNFIRWVSLYPAVLICAKMSVFNHLTVNMHNVSTFVKGVCENLGQRLTWSIFYTCDSDSLLSRNSG